MIDLNLAPGDRVRTPCGHTGTVFMVFDGNDVRTAYGVSREVGTRSYKYVVRFDDGTPVGVFAGNCFKADGSQQYPGPDVARRIDPATSAATSAASSAPDWSGKLKTRNGLPVELVGTMTDGKRAVRVGYSFASRGEDHRAIEIREADGRVLIGPGKSPGDVVNKVEKTKTYRNFYADHSLGETRHKTRDEALMRTKFGKVCVGVLREEFEDNVRVYARMLSAARYRDGRTSAKGTRAMAYL